MHGVDVENCVGVHFLPTRYVMRPLDKQLASLQCLHFLQVEQEMRKLLAAMDRQKAASAAKMKQLAVVLSELQIPLVPALPNAG